VIGWSNVSVKNGGLQADFGYVASQPPAEPVFQRELDAEMVRLKAFLGLAPRTTTR
jgi:uncharacterized protein